MKDECLSTLQFSPGFVVVVVAKKSRSDFSDATNVSSLIGQSLISIFLKVRYCLQPSEVRIYVTPHFLIMKTMSSSFCNKQLYVLLISQPLETDFKFHSGLVSNTHTHN